MHVRPTRGWPAQQDEPHLTRFSDTTENTRSCSFTRLKVRRLKKYMKLAD